MSYTIEPTPRDFDNWPTSLFASASAIRYTKYPKNATITNTIPAHISFLLSQHTKQAIDAFVCRAPGPKRPRRFVKTTGSVLLDLLLELLDLVMKFVLTPNTQLNDNIHLHEEAKRFVIVESRFLPEGLVDKRFAWHSDVRYLPQPFNQVQYSCRTFRQRQRVHELKHNVLKCNGFTFDSLLLVRGRPELREFFANISRVNLVGRFSLEEIPDERLP